MVLDARLSLPLPLLPCLWEAAALLAGSVPAGEDQSTGHAHPPLLAP